MADVEMKARFEQYVNFRAKFGIIQNSFPEVDQTVTADSTNPVSSKAVYEFTKDIEEDLDTRIDEVSDALNRKIADKPSRGEFKTVGGQSIFGEGDIPVGGGGDGKVKDVTVNGISVLEEDGTATITTSNMLSDGTISNRNVSEETNEVVMPLGDLDRLVKHAMGDGKGANWDETSKRNARSRLGVPSVSDLNAKQNKLTPGTNIKIESDEISAEPYDDTEIKEEIASLDGKIKELELFKYPNMTIIGEPVINHGQISGFSASSYLKFPFLVDFKNQSFVITMAFATGPNVVNQENIFDSDFGLAFAVRNARFVIAISTNGTTWDLGEGVGSLVVQPNTNYFVRLAWDKSSYSLSYSFDGEAYTTDIVKTGTVQPYPKQIFVGVGENFATVVNSFSGIVNLNSCSLAVNGEIIWTGMDDAGLSTRADVSLSNIDADGEAKIKEVAETTTIKANLTELDNSVVKTSAQTLTDAQKAQARHNIGVGDSGTVDEVARAEIADVKTDLTDVNDKFAQKYKAINLANPDKYTLGYIDKYGGVNPSASNYRYTERISVNSGDYVFFGGCKVRWIAAYKNGVISPSDGGEEKKAYLVPNGVTEVVFSMYATDINIFGVYVDLLAFSYYKPYGLDDLINTQFDYLDDSIEMYNRLDKSKVQLNKFFRETFEIIDHPSYSISEYIRVKQGEKLRISEGVRTVAIINPDNTIRLYDNTGWENTSHIINVEVDGYIVLNIFTNQIDNVSVVLADKYYGYKPYGVRVNKNIFNYPLTDLSDNVNLICNVGDSIAENRAESHSYSRQISELLRANLYDYALGGSTVSRIEGQTMGCILTQVETLINQHGTEKPDIILIDGMANDHTQHRTVGEVVSSGESVYTLADYTATFDTTTYTGSLEQCFKLLRASYDSAFIIFVIPHKQERFDTTWVSMLANAREVCEKWSIGIVDMDKDGELNTRLPIMRTKYTDAGGTHQNTLGNKKFYVPQIINKIKKYFV